MKQSYSMGKFTDVKTMLDFKFSLKKLKFNKEATTVAMVVGDTTNKSLRSKNLQASRMGETGGIISST
ncbi:hypothetical protein MKW92_050452 [Papaver armeniacum]|nr:hypothetical protein MKW92_050452 [Papaver armeniacum]